MATITATGPATPFAGAALPTAPTEHPVRRDRQGEAR